MLGLSTDMWIPAVVNVWSVGIHEVLVLHSPKLIVLLCV